jgi:hypothetical protein
MYESHYVKAADPAGGRAVWLRHTVLSRPDGGGQRTTTWLTLFDRDAEIPVVQRRVTDEAGYTPAAAGWSACAYGSLGPNGADGSMQDATWSLRWEPVDAEPVPYLPKRWLYDRLIPRSNGVALLPFGRMSGHADIAAPESRGAGADAKDGERFQVEQEVVQLPGMTALYQRDQGQTPYRTEGAHQSARSRSPIRHRSGRRAV